VDSSHSLEKRQYTKIQNRLSIAFSILASVITLVISLAVYLEARRNLYTQFTERVLSFVSLAELQQLPNLLSNITTPEDQDTSIYKFLQQEHQKIVDSDPTLGSVYTLRQDQQGNIYFVVDAVSRDLSQSKPSASYGDFYTNPGPVLRESFATLNRPIAEEGFYADDWGTWLSAYAPIYRDDGTREGVLGINLSAEAVLTAERNMLITSLVILAFALPIFAIVGWVVGNRLTRPIVELINGVNRITSGDLEYRVAIKSGDEIEALADSFNIMTSRVGELVNNLEKRVADRTAELEIVSKQMTKRADLLTTVSDVSRAISTVQDIEKLLDSIVELISNRFNYYHTGIFIIDDKREYAVLQAASSEGGKRMLARSHKLKVGEEGIVGFVTDSGQPRVAVDTGAEAIYFKNPDLPGTRSELTLPLMISERIIGALDVQSEQPDAFSEDDIQVLGTLANQVAVAIQNASLFTETRKALNEAQIAYQRFVQTGWKRFMERSTQIGYQFTGNTVNPLKTALDRPEINAVLESGEATTDAVTENKASIPTLAIPIKVRGETIGVLDIRALRTDRAWEKTDITTAQTIADRLAFALENARLIDESQKRAARERAISDMTSKIGSSVDVNTILQQTVQELGRLIGNSEVIIQIGSGNNNQTKE
jgi:GAF domain-containing protein/HAMP domain-containing protein